MDAVRAGGPVTIPTETGLRLHVPHGLEALRDADTVIVPGHRRRRVAIRREALAALRAAAARGARIASICTGAFVLAAAGLLDGRRATTHWRYAARLAAASRAVDVDPDVLYVDDGDVLTSAGVAAGIDLCLHMVRADHGAAVANAVARRHRGGRAPRRRPGAVRPAPGARRRRQRPLRHTRLDGGAAWSGRSPSRDGAPRRLQPALVRPPLPRGDRHDAAAVADRAARRPRRSGCSRAPTSRSTTSPPARGFGTAGALRQHFARAVATSPTAYRRTFRGVPST